MAPTFHFTQHGRWKTLLLLLLSSLQAWAQTTVGADGNVGTRGEPAAVSRLEITKSGIYENFLVDGAGASGNLVKITADNVTVRHCEIRNGSGNGIGVFGSKIVIENCRIHHMLAGTFKDQRDSHGITGRWGDVVIRNCDISYTSGDSIQFDPDRKSSGRVVIERCHLWTGPLPADVAGFKAGERPGENAVDTKTPPEGPRCMLTIRDCFLHGWNRPAQIGNVAALNLKENVDAEISHCVFDDNEIALRVRGPGARGGACVTITGCAVHNTIIGVRAEDEIEQLKIARLGFGSGVVERIKFVNGQATAGFENTGEHDAPPLDPLLKRGTGRKADGAQRAAE
jgi:hypothetical protein